MLKKSGKPLAIASGSTRPSILPVLKKLKIEPDALVTAEDVKKGKPNPGLFICSAERLGISPNDCVVIEDSQAGIEAAKAAGMKVMLFIDENNS